MWNCSTNTHYPKCICNNLTRIPLKDIVASDYNTNFISATDESATVGNESCDRVALLSPGHVCNVLLFREVMMCSSDQNNAMTAVTYHKIYTRIFLVFIFSCQSTLYLTASRS